MIEFMRASGALAGAWPVAGEPSASRGKPFAELVAEQEAPPGVHAPPGGKTGQAEGASTNSQIALTISPDSPPPAEPSPEEPTEPSAGDPLQTQPWAMVAMASLRIAPDSPAEALSAVPNPAAVAPSVPDLSANAVVALPEPPAAGQLEADSPKFQVGTTLLPENQVEALNVTRIATEPVSATSLGAGPVASDPLSETAKTAVTASSSAEAGQNPAGTGSATAGPDRALEGGESSLPPSKEGSGKPVLSNRQWFGDPVEAAARDGVHVEAVGIEERAANGASELTLDSAGMGPDSITSFGDFDRNPGGGGDSQLPAQHPTDVRHAVRTPDSAPLGPTETQPATEADRADVARQIIERLDTLALLGTGRRVTMELEPHGLGRVAIQLLSFGGAMEATLVASDREVKSALEGAAPQLGAALERRGIELASISVRHDATLDFSDGNWNRGRPFTRDPERQDLSHRAMAERPTSGPIAVARRQTFGSIAALDLLV